MIHQLAARKATQEFEDGNGWLSSATIDRTDKLVKDKFTHQFPLLQRREAVRLAVEFQVGGKYCSFVAVEANEAEIAAKRQNALKAIVNREVEEEKEDWEMVPDMDEQNYSGMCPTQLATKHSESLQTSLSAIQIPYFSAC